jgi:hypothetical protein
MVPAIVKPTSVGAELNNLVATGKLMDTIVSHKSIIYRFLSTLCWLSDNSITC